MPINSNNQITFDGPQLEAAAQSVYEYIESNNPISETTPDSTAETHRADIAYETAEFIINEYLSHSFTQYIYYIEYLLNKDRDLSKQLSEHIIEDANKADDIVKIGLERVLIEHLKEANQDSYTIERDAEPTEGITDPSHLESQVFSFGDEIGSIYTPLDEVTTVSSHGEFMDLREDAVENYYDTVERWSLTLRAMFIDYIRNYPVGDSERVLIDIPSEQFSGRRGEPFIDLFTMIEYWTIDGLVRAATNQVE